jgi:Uma2 family endonuclease
MARPRAEKKLLGENDYGAQADQAMAAKRADYFAAGTLVVWDVDVPKEGCSVYRVSAPDTPTIYHRSEIAEAEPALPRWTMPVDDLFT